MKMEDSQFKMIKNVRVAAEHLWDPSERGSGAAAQGADPGSWLCSQAFWANGRGSLCLKPAPGQDHMGRLPLARWIYIKTSPGPETHYWSRRGKGVRGNALPGELGDLAGFSLQLEQGEGYDS